MNFNKYSIKTRLFALTGLGSLATALIIGVGLYSSHHLHRNILRLTERNIPLTSSASEIRVAVIQNWVNSLYLTRITDTSLSAEIEADMKKNSDEISVQFEKLQKGIEGPDEKKLLDDVLQKRKEYTESRKHFLELTKQSMHEEANAFLMSNVRPQLNAYLGSLDALNAQRALDVEETAKTAEANVHNSWMTFLVLGVVSLVGGIVFSLVIVRSITLPLNWAISLAGKIAKGNLKSTVSVQEGDDEITRLINALAMMQSQLHEIIGVIQSNSEELAQSSQEFYASSSDVTIRSRTQSEATSSIAASIEEMTQSIYQIAEHAEQTRSIVNVSEQLSQQNSQAIGETMGEMQDISTSVSTFASQLGQLDEQSQQISAILNVIREVAEQTNLLALNAAIEAARAGEQGRGFAVVADEVRKLAERTTQATQEISNTISTIQGSTAKTVESIGGAVKRVDSGVAHARHAQEFATKLHSGAAEASDVVSGISDAIREQSQASEQIAQNISRIAEMTEHNSVTVSQMSKGAEKLNHLAESLQQAVHRFSM